MLYAAVQLSDKLPSGADIWLLNMLKVVKSQKRLMFIPLGWCWWNLLLGEKQWTLTGLRGSNASQNGYD